jgi:hypothetical protein
MTLATAEFDCYGKTTRRAAFLAEMEHVVPWSAPCGLIDYPKPGNGRPPVGVERMLRIYFFAAMVQPVGPGSGRGALRFAGDARFCQDRSRPRAGARRDHGVPLPPSARNARGLVSSSSQRCGGILQPTGLT